MRLIALLLMAYCLHTGTTTHAQKISYSGKNVSLETVFNVIEKQTGYVVFYDYRQIAGAKPVTIDAKQQPIKDFLRACFKDQPFGFVIEDKTIMVVKKMASKVNETVKEVLPPAKGFVKDAEGRPLAGATVEVKGSKNSTLTDAGGNFNLEIKEGEVLVISYVGYATQEIRVSKDMIKNSGNFSFTLSRITEALDEQIVIAYGTSSRRMLTGSIGKVSSGEISEQSVLNPLQAIQGRISGLLITEQTGMPGGNFNVQIRGQNSLRNTNADNGNNPLYIIDGVPYFSNPLNSITNTPYQSIGNTPATGISPLVAINPSDIESIEVLKDGDATAIYGSRGANGVILITTKRGKTGSMKFDVNAYMGSGNVTRKMKLLHTREYTEMRKEAFANNGVTNYPANAYDINGVWKEDRYTDWQKELLGGTANYIDAQAGITGGSQNAQYRFSGGYHRESTVFPGDYSTKRASNSLSLIATSPNGKFKVNALVNYSYTASNMLGNDLTFTALSLPPNAPPLYDSSGNLNWENNTFTNPLRYTMVSYVNKIYNVLSNAVLSYEVLPSLIIKTSFGLTNTNIDEVRKQFRSYYSPAQATTQPLESTFGTNKSKSWIVEPQVTWTRPINKGVLSLLLGSTFQNETRDQLSQNASGFLTEDMMDNISAVPSESVKSSYYYSDYSYAALFGRINYEFDNSYIINFTGRRDGSSRFGPDRQFANFGSIGTAWIFSNLNSIKSNLRFLSFGKLRASYGTTGNDQIPDYGFMNTYTPTGAGQYQGIKGLLPSRLLNPDFRWETNRKLEVALELGFLKDRVLITSAYYNNKSSNQLVGYPLPPTTGFGSVQYNLDATVRNTGWEFELSTINVLKDNFSWRTSFNLSIPRNKLLEFPNIEGSSYADTYVVGEPLSILKLYHGLGVNNETGLFEVEDINKDGRFNIADQTIIKFTGVKCFGGLSNRISFKNIEIDIFIQFSKQNGTNYLFNSSVPGSMNNQPTEVLGRWRKSGDLTSIQKYMLSSTTFNRYRSSEMGITDASYIRLKTFHISYNLSSRVQKLLHLSKMKVFLQGQNLITITKYKGLDPENKGLGLPPLRNLTAGIQVTL